MMTAREAAEMRADQPTYLCAHCRTDITAPGRRIEYRVGKRMVRYTATAPDSGGDCPTCKSQLCHRCAGGWC